MEDFKNNNKILFIPGWLDTGGRHGYKNSLDIWSKNIDINQDYQVDYVIAHSISSLVALHNWQLYKNFKIILVNPVFSKKRICQRWYKFNRSEGISNSFKKSIKLGQIIPALTKTIKLFRIPAFDIIDIIPKEDLTIIYGENDTHLLESRVLKNLEARGFRIIAIKGVGHNYEEKIDKAIAEIVSLNS